MINQETPGDFDSQLDDAAKLVGRLMKRTTCKPRIELRNIAPEETVRRFVDLPKLFDLLVHRRLLLPKLGLLMEGDPFECSSSKNYDNLRDDELVTLAKNLQEFAPREQYGPSWSSVTEVNMECVARRMQSNATEFMEHVSSMPTQDLKEVVGRLERERSKKELVCGCWFRGEFESDAMWKIYARQLGVAIVSSVPKITSAITQCSVPEMYAANFKLTLAAVQYEDSSQCRSSEPWLTKRSAFRHEQEARLYCTAPWVSSPGLELTVNVPALIEEIVISPFAERWQAAAIVGAVEILLELSQKESGRTIKPRVRQSDHMVPPGDNWPMSPIQHAAQSRLAEAMPQ